jgi:hypothetical protein
VTFDLPASHASTDTDHDGQLGMYEWRRSSGRSLREFFEYDANGDGFVTPREIYVVIGFPKQDADADNADESYASRGEEFTISVPGNNATSVPAAAGDSDERLTAEAGRYFGLLDKDDDGAISAEEWGSSIRIGGMFRKGGLDLSQPMSEEAFVQNYVTLSKAEG